MTPVVNARRRVGDIMPASTPRNIRTPIRKEPMTLTARVPDGNAGPKYFSTQPEIR